MIHRYRTFIKIFFTRLTDKCGDVGVLRVNGGGGLKKTKQPSLSSCHLSFSVTRLEGDTRVGKGCFPPKHTKKMSQMWLKLLFAPLLAYSLCASPSRLKILMLVAYFKKKTLKIASHHEMQGKRAIFSPHRWGNWRDTSGSGTWKLGGLREKKNFRRRMQTSNVTDIFFTRATAFLPVGVAFIGAPTKFSLLAFSQGGRKCLNNHHKHRRSLLNLTKLALINYDLFLKPTLEFALGKKQNSSQC